MGRIYDYKVNYSQYLILRKERREQQMKQYEEHNVEIPKEENLKLLAPEKDHKSVYAPMRYIQQGVLESPEECKKHRHAPRFAPAGQSTQMIVGDMKLL